jgi:putative endonuclease
MAFVTYILQSLKDQRYYSGHTDNLQERLNRHNAGKVTSTKSRKPFKLHYSEQFNSKSEAYRRELFFKSFDGRKWLFKNKIISPR